MENLFIKHLVSSVVQNHSGCIFQAKNKGERTQGDQLTVEKVVVVAQFDIFIS